MLVAAVVLAALYLQGVRRLAARGRRWPPNRTVSFLSGAATVAAAAFVPDATFLGHMWEHVLLGMVGPLLFALGAPVTLALQTAGPATRPALRRAVHSRLAAVLAHPIVGWLLFGGTLVAVSFAPVLDLAERSEPFHLLLHVHLLLVGSLFLWALVGIDPVPRRLPHGGRLLAVLAAVPFHAFVGIALMSTRAAVDPVAYPSVADQHRAAGLLWASGELFSAVMAGVVFRQWLVADRRAAARADRMADSAR
jgi:putative copper resistance protein D